MSAPAARRSDLVAAQRARPPFGGRHFPAGDPAVRVGTTGTGDDLLLLAWSATDLRHEIAAGVRVLGAVGLHAAMRIANTLPGALATPGALLLGDVHEAMGALDVPLGVPDTEAAARAAWELVDRVQCQVLVLDPATAATLFAAAPAGPRPWWAGIVWLVRDGDTRPPSPPAGFAGWQRRWLAVPEVTSFVAATCAGDRFHLDDELEARADGGELVLAARDAHYATGLRARVEPGCACGRPGAVVVL